jgi:hypothetical protein
MEASSRSISNQCRITTADRDRARMCCTNASLMLL